MAVDRRLAAMLVAGAIGCGARTDLERPELASPPPCADVFAARETPRCDPTAIMDPPSLTWAGVTALAVLAGGCDVVAVVTAGGPDGPGLRVSTDGGASFAPLRSLPPDSILPGAGAPRFATIALSDDLTVYALARAEGGVLRVHASDDLGVSWSEPAEITGHPEMFGPALSIAGPRVAIYWVSHPSPSGVWVARSDDSARSFEPPLRLGEGRLASASYPPAVCWAGDAHLVASWLDCTGDDCTGADRDGIALGMAAVVSPGEVRAQVLFELDDGQHAPIAGCSPDGRALVAWSAAPYAAGADYDLVVAPLEACGAAPPAARFAGADSLFFEAGSPRPTLGADGALLSWRSSFNRGSGLATLDRGGALVTATLDPDTDGDGVLDLPVDACALRGGGYALLSLDGMRGPLVATLLDEGGAPIAVRVLGAPEFPALLASLSCDARGRAHFAWHEADGAHYAAMHAP